MVKFKELIILMIAIFSLSSCENESDFSETQINVPESIRSIIDAFRTDINVGSRSNSDFQILSVDTKFYKIDSDTVVEISQTRSDDSIFDISTVRIKSNDNEGFAVLSSDERLHKIFFYTENGSISDTVNIPPLKEYIDLIPSFAAYEITGIVSSTETRGTNTQNIIISPIVRFAWGQGEPYNNLAPACGCKKCLKRGGHRPIGCVATATAQTLATIDRFKPTHYGCRDINFSTLPATTKLMELSSESKRLQVAHFFYEVALGCQIKFGCEGSSSHAKAAYHYLNDIGFTCKYVKGPIDCQQLIQELQKGFPHIMRGHGSDGGHCWIVDGIKISSSGTSFSCNWGWNGRSNGWVDGNPFTTENDDGSPLVFSKELGHIYIQSAPQK